MSNEPFRPIPDSAKKLKLATHSDEICDQFEAEWMAGKSPWIEAYLADWTEDPAFLLAELLPVEIELRRRSGVPFSLQEFLKRFPQHAELVREIVHDAELRGDQYSADRQPMPTELGHYRLLEELGSGGMGTVYKALHTQLDKVVAIKVLSGAHISNPDAIARFQREMKAVGKFSHPNIIGAHDAGEIHGTHFLVMEYVEGFDLSKVVQREGRLSTADACEVVRQAAIGLEHAHAHGLVHRDIKPSNLMLTADGKIKILDMGLARLQVLSPGEQELTSTGQLMGTLDYMAPEQGNDSSAVDIRADVYSLGATLYKLVTGAAPFDSKMYDTPVKKLMALSTAPHLPLRKSSFHVPKALSALVDRMLAKSPSKRPATPGKVAAELAAFTPDSDLIALASRCRSTSEDIGLLGDDCSNTEDYLPASLTDTHPSQDASIKRPAALITTSPKKPARSKHRWPLMILLGCGIVGAAIVATRFAMRDTPIDDPIIASQDDSNDTPVEDSALKDIPIDDPIVASQDDSNDTPVEDSASKAQQSLPGAGFALATLFNMTDGSLTDTLSTSWHKYVSSLGNKDQSLQVALIIDGTDSMAKDVRSIVDALPRIAEGLNLHKSDPSLISFGVVIFRDADAPSGKVAFPLGKSFTSDIQVLHSALAEVDTETGRPYFEEAVDLAMHEAMSQLEWNSSANTVRWLIVLSDSPPYPEGMLNEKNGAKRTYADEELVKTAKESSTILHAVLCSAGYISGDAIQNQNAKDKASDGPVMYGSQARLKKLRRAYDVSLERTRPFMGKMASSTGGFFLDLSEEFQKNLSTEPKGEIAEP